MMNHQLPSLSYRLTSLLNLSPNKEPVLCRLLDFFKYHEVHKINSSTLLQGLFIHVKIELSLLEHFSIFVLTHTD